MEIENKIWLDDESLGYVDNVPEEPEDTSENIHNLTGKELKNIEEFLMLDEELDEDTFDYYFVAIKGSDKEVYDCYVTLENKLYNNYDVRTFEEFVNALALPLEDRFYTEINRYVKFSNGVIYYINDNTLLFDN
jgi:hypothetical protein